MAPRRGETVEERREGESADWGGRISGIEGRLATMEERFNSFEGKVEANFKAIQENHRESMEAIHKVLNSWGKERENPNPNPNPNPENNLEETREASGGATQTLAVNKGTLETIPEEVGGERLGEGDPRPVGPWAGPWDREAQEGREGHGQGWGNHIFHGGGEGRRRGRIPWEEGGRGGERGQGRWGRILDPHGPGGWEGHGQEGREGHGPRGGGPRARGNWSWGGAGGREGHGGRARDPRGYGGGDPRDGEPWGEPWARDAWEEGGHGADGWGGGGRGSGPTNQGVGPHGQGARGAGRRHHGREAGKEKKGTWGTRGTFTVLMLGRKETAGGGGMEVGADLGREGRTAKPRGAHTPSGGRERGIGREGRGEGRP